MLYSSAGSGLPYRLILFVHLGLYFFLYRNLEVVLLFLETPLFLSKVIGLREAFQ